MTRSLQRIYLFWVIPAMLLALGAKAAAYLGLTRPALPPWIYGTVFVLSAATAIAGPILIRAGFAQAHRTQTTVASNAFYRFQKRLLYIALITPYWAAAALMFQFPRFHATGIMLFALYAVYYYYPSDRRINFDKKLFRVSHGSETKS